MWSTHFGPRASENRHTLLFTTEPPDFADQPTVHTGGEFEDIPESRFGETEESFRSRSVLHTPACIIRLLNHPIPRWHPCEERNVFLLVRTPLPLIYRDIHQMICPRRSPQVARTSGLTSKSTSIWPPPCSCFRDFFHAESCFDEVKSTFFLVTSVRIFVRELRCVSVWIGNVVTPRKRVKLRPELPYI